LIIQNLATYFFLDEGIVKAVDGVSFEIPQAKTFGLMGESGCGKSITALSIMRLVPPPGRIVRGKIIFDGVDLLSLPLPQMQKLRGNKISMIFQEPLSSLNPVFTIGEQISETLMLHQKITRKEAYEIAIRMLQKVKIPDPHLRVRDYPHQFSGGMRQRAMIAMALCCKPKILIADEPTTALDVTIQVQILQLLAELQSEYKMSILLISHDFDVISKLANFVGIMYASKIVEVSDIKGLLDEPLHPYTKGLILSTPKLGMTKKHRLPAIPGSVPNPLDYPQGCRFHPRCQYTKQICREIEPELRDVGNKRLVACHLI
jgi:peptide/nickel transport system ATP-binding protein